MIESLSDLKEFLSTYYLIHATVRRGLGISIGESVREAQLM